MTNGTEREGRAPAGFRRELGLWDTTVVVAGAILGVGIFVNPSNVARILPDPGWMLAAWFAGGGVALLGSFVYAELGARLPEVGGQYVYLARSWSPFVGYLYGVTLLFVINSGGMAAVASVLASYVDGSILPLGKIGRLALAGAVLIALAEINVRGVRPGKRVNNSLMALKLAGIAVLIGLALLRRPEAATRFAMPAAGGATLAAFFAALVPILFAYGGWQNCGSVAAEIRDPRRTLARANVLGVGLIVAVYVGLVVLDLWVLPPQEVAGSSALAADVARTLVGAPGARFVGVLIVLSCLGFLAVMTMTGPRLYYAMAADGLFWRRAARLHPRFSTPSFTIRMQAAVALILLLSPDLRPAPLLRRLRRLALLRPHRRGPVRPAPASGGLRGRLPRAGPPGHDGAVRRGRRGRRPRLRRLGAGAGRRRLRRDRRRGGELSDGEVAQEIAPGAAAVTHGVLLGGAHLAVGPALPLRAEDRIPAEAVAAARRQDQITDGLAAPDHGRGTVGPGQDADRPRGRVAQRQRRAGDPLGADRFEHPAHERSRKAAQRRELEPRLLHHQGAADAGESGVGLGREHLFQIERLDLGQVDGDRFQPGARQAPRLGELSGVAGDQQQAPLRAQLAAPGSTR